MSESPQSSVGPEIVLKLGDPSGLSRVGWGIWAFVLHFTQALVGLPLEVSVTLSEVDFSS